MALLADLQDDFDDNTVDPVLWPSNYNTAGDPPTETGGRARVPCDTGYAAYASEYAYALADSQLSCRFYPAALNGATAECWSQILIQTTTAGTDATIEYDATEDVLAMTVRVGYSDPGYTSIPYDPVEHAYVRLSESGGTLTWATSPDGSTWTTRRTETAPAWVTDDLQVQLICHRGDGTANHAEFDNLNTGVPQVLALTPAAEAASARAVPGRKTRALGVAAEVATAQASGRARARALGRATSTASGRAVAGAKHKVPGVAAETSAGQPTATVKSAMLPPATAVEGAQGPDRRKTRGLTPAAGSTTAQPAAPSKTLGLAVASEVDGTRPLPGAKAVALAPATSTAEAPGLASSSAGALTPGAETATARPPGGRKAQALPVASGTCTVGALAASKRIALAAAEEVGQAQRFTLPGSANAVEESSTARPLAGEKRLQLSAAVAQDGTRPLGLQTTVQLGRATEAGQAAAAGRRKHTALGTAASVGTVRPLPGDRATALGTAQETGRALIGPKIRLTQAVDRSRALAVVGSRQHPADALVSSTSGPVLAPSVSGAVLAVSSSGPQLAATNIGGG